MALTKEEIDSFTSVLFQRYGLDFTCYEPQSLNRRLNRVLHVLKIDTLHDLWSAMLKDKNLIFKFMDEISVGLTSMFRDPMMWSGLRTVLYNEFKGRSKIDIWNAGCSTGEEVFTLAIVLKEMNLLEQANILATDMNQTALQVAKSGIYHKVKMVEYESKFKEYNRFGNFSKYYLPHESMHVQMNHELNSAVTYKYHNLITDPVNGSYDFIFCRNVMIYFDAPAKAKLMEKFLSVLKPGGYFIQGFFDSILSEDEKSNFNSDLVKLRIFRKVKGQALQQDSFRRTA
ncbi:CheR family methyltransferase [Fulvivirga lutea]|uniref:Protein-glutamate O-methyltransferase CheR n=1 Tax=Fulvivirga lutea TaxID=2810512 RepID=A0A974WGE9_9BACT|nr:protein-glutamate O-methyltransferase CheR [Fulvivirga lutea]QSE97575.1 protein-glutamate O-methyltransferase CheR [Fulvivirga lutea]